MPPLTMTSGVGAVCWLRGVLDVGCWAAEVDDCDPSFRAKSTQRVARECDPSVVIDVVQG